MAALTSHRHQPVSTKCLILLLAVGLLAGAGCGQAKMGEAPATREAGSGKDATLFKSESGRSPNLVAQDEAGEAGVVAGSEITRKIIYTADVELIVEDFSKCEQDLMRLLKEKKGYVAKGEVSGTTGAHRYGRWTVRVPVDQFDSFRDAVSKLGELQKSTTNADDITDQYYGLKDHIESKKVERERLLKHMEKSTTILKDTLDVERELARVDRELDQLQGQFNRLDKLSSLTTVNINMHERKGYIPPTAPPFGTTVSRTFEGSLEWLTNVGKGIVLVAVALSVWLPFIAVFAAALWFGIRWLIRRTRTAAPPILQPVEIAAPDTGQS